MKIAFKKLGSVIVLLTCMLFLITPAAANGVPVKITLRYLPDLSNFGPRDATGVVDVSTGEAWIELRTDGLPQLENELYEVWVVGAETGQMVSLGTFNADEQAQAEYIAEFEVAPPQIDYEALVISVEPVPDSSPEADDRRVIGGFFPKYEIRVVESDTPPASENPSDGVPDSGTGSEANANTGSAADTTTEADPAAGLADNTGTDAGVASESVADPETTDQPATTTDSAAAAEDTANTNAITEGAEDATAETEATTEGPAPKYLPVSGSIRTTALVSSLFLVGLGIMLAGVTLWRRARQPQ